MAIEKQCLAMLPNQPGMRVTKIHQNFEYGKLLHPDTYGKNKSRDKGTSHKKIEDFTRVIKNGQYTPEHHIAPTVSKIKGTKWYDLNSGVHRLAAHRCAKKNTIYAIEVEFFDFENKPAKYWEAMWRNNENREDGVYIKNLRTDDDIVMTVVDLIDTKVIHKTEKDIESTLRDLHCTNAQIHKLRSLILVKIGKNKGVVTTYTKQEMKNFEKLESENTKTYTYNILPTRGGKHDFEGEHSNRLMNKFMTDLIKNPNNFENGATIICQISGASHDVVINVREEFKHLTTKRMKKYEKAVEIWQLKKPKIVMKFVSQLYGENKSNKLTSA